MPLDTGAGAPQSIARVGGCRVSAAGVRHAVRQSGGRLRAVVEAIDALVLLVPTILGAPLLRHAYNRWGTTKGEGRAAMKGDELIASPKLGYTRWITIDAPPDEVWQWLAQIGQGAGRALQL